jgi:hypothetical protein
MVTDRTAWADLACRAQPGPGILESHYLFSVIAGDLLRLTELDPGLVADGLGLSALDSFFIDPLRAVLSLR